MTTPHRPTLRFFDEAAIRGVVDRGVALGSAQRAFSALARGRAVVPPPLGVDFSEVHGEVHVKGAYIRSSPIFVFKFATGFYGNVQMGVPTGSGLVLVFDASTGFPLGILADNGYLTDVRTAAAGALAAKHLSPKTRLTVGVVGAGVQGRLQLEHLSEVRELAEVRVWSRRESSRRAFAQRMSAVLRVPVVPGESPAAAVRDADLVVCATPSREPLLTAAMLRPGATVIALGSDGPDKRELSSDVLAGADKIVTDLTAQCLRLGELHHAVDDGSVAASDVHAELGQVVEGQRSGREANETIVCDLTGVGVQDAAIAEAVYRALTGWSPDGEDEGLLD